jgi:hypothetical protein
MRRAPQERSHCTEVVFADPPRAFPPPAGRVRFTFLGGQRRVSLSGEMIEDAPLREPLLPGDDVEQVVAPSPRPADEDEEKDGASIWEVSQEARRSRELKPWVVGDASSVRGWLGTEGACFNGGRRRQSQAVRHSFLASGLWSALGSLVPGDGWSNKGRIVCRLLVRDVSYTPLRAAAAAATNTGGDEHVQVGGGHRYPCATRGDACDGLDAGLWAARGVHRVLSFHNAATHALRRRGAVKAPTAGGARAAGVRRPR